MLNVDDSPTVNHGPMVTLTDELELDRLHRQPRSGAPPPLGDARVTVPEARRADTRRKIAVTALRGMRG
jgi:hypothetical protein